MIAAVVLAAGAARRFGEQKLLAPLQGRPVVRWTVEQVTASGVDRTVVVLGRETDAVRAALADLPVSFVPNPRFQEGMGTSVAAGVGALDASAEAVLVVLGDQPIPAQVIDRLLRAHRASKLPIVAPSYGGQRGNPVLFSSSVFSQLLQLEGDRGARGLLERSPGKLLLVPFPHPPPPDIDTPEDLAEYASYMARGVQRPGSSTSDQPNRGAQ